MQEKKVVRNERDIIYPVFKFQSGEHAEKMWKQGNVHLTNISKFREGKYGGLIDDPREGLVSVSFPNYDNANCRVDLKIDNAFIYCASYDFLSDTLESMLKNGRDNCVLITDVEEMAYRVSDIDPDLIFIGIGDCIYSGRDISEEFNSSSGIGYQILQKPILAAFVKPVKHQPQREVRFLWFGNENTKNKESVNRDIDLQQFLIPVSYKGVEQLFSDSVIHSVKTKVKTKDEMNDVWFDINYPKEVFRPIIRKNEDGVYEFGFRTDSSKFRGVRVHGGGIEISGPPLGTVIWCGRLEDIERIEYSVIN